MLNGGALCKLLDTSFRIPLIVIYAGTHFAGQTPAADGGANATVKMSVVILRTEQLARLFAGPARNLQNFLADRSGWWQNYRGTACWQLIRIWRRKQTVVLALALQAECARGRR